MSHFLQACQKSVPSIYHSYSNNKKACKIEIFSKTSNTFFIKNKSEKITDAVCFILANLEGSNFKIFLARRLQLWWSSLDTINY